jgi:hypothetical protein
VKLISTFWQDFKYLSGHKSRKEEQNQFLCKKEKTNLKKLASLDVLMLLVPEVGIEPTRARGPEDFETEKVNLKNFNKIN